MYLQRVHVENTIQLYFYFSLKNYSSFSVVSEGSLFFPDPCLTELGYCADLISRGNHPGGRKHNLLINKNVSWHFQENDRAPRGSLIKLKL